MPRQEPGSDRDLAVDSAALARSIAAGDEAAFATFYRAWFPATLALARTASHRDESFCLDVVQDVMMTVAKKMPTLHDGKAVGAWMRRTVVNAVTDRLRQEQRRRRREQRQVEVPLVSGELEPWVGMAILEQREWLAARLAELPARDRELLAARFSQAISVTAAGALLGLGPDAAHGRLRRVLVRLRRLAAEWMS